MDKGKTVVLLETGHDPACLVWSATAYFPPEGALLFFVCYVIYPPQKSPIFYFAGFASASYSAVACFCFALYAFSG